MSRWSFGAASVRGISHVKNGTRKQDAKRCFAISGVNPIFCAIVSDGAGSASHGGEGAAIVCRSMGEFIRAYFSRQPNDFPSDELFWDWLDETRDRIFAAAAKRSLSPRDFAATMVVSITNGFQTQTAHVGDGAIVGRLTHDGTWLLLSESENGEYASTTFFVTDSGVPRLRTKLWDSEIDAIFLFSDGIENQVLDAATGQPHGAFFGPMARPFADSEVVGRDYHLSERLAEYLDSEKFAEHTDDDKTLVIAVRK